MDSLRPERDELDQFKTRKSGAGTKRAVKKTEIKPKPVVGASKSSPFTVLALVVLVLITAALAWGYYQQQSELTLLRDELKDAAGFIGQSKLLMARFEGELNETGAELSQSGSAAEKKLAFLDSEMRKLWGVSNDKNRKAIQSNVMSIESLENNSVKQRVRVAALEKTQSSVLSGIERLKTEVGTMESSVAAAASEATLTREAMAEELGGVRQSLSVLAELKAGVEENKSAISSIDASRRQLNERVVELDRKLNEVQLLLKSSNNPALVQ